MIKHITDFLDDCPFLSVVTYYTILAFFAFLFLTPVSAQTPTASYVKEWKCPYCYHHWKYGERCQNEECASNQW